MSEQPTSEPSLPYEPEWWDDHRRSYVAPGITAEDLYQAIKARLQHEQELEHERDSEWEEDFWSSEGPQP